MPRKKKTLEEKQIEMKAEQQGTNPQLVVWQFRKGVKSMMRKKGIKQKAQEFLETCMDIVVPDEWLVNGLESLQGRGMTFQQVVTFRRLYHATTGTKNLASKECDDMFNRLFGKVPLLVRHKEGDDDDDFLELTDDQLNREISRLAETVRLKRLPVATVTAVENDAKKT